MVNYFYSQLRAINTNTYFSSAVNILNNQNSLWFLLVPIIGGIVYRCLQHKDDFRAKYNLVGPVQKYRPENVLHEINKPESLNKTICLFVCRREDQSLPETEGELWVSGDRLVSGIIPPDRLHIWADFKQEEQLKRYYGCFDKVVVDISSVKFLGLDFESRLMKLLRPSKKAELVFENSFLTKIVTDQNGKVSKDDLEIPCNIKEQLAKIGLTWFEQTYPKDSSQYQDNFKEFSLSIESIAQHYQWSEEKIHIAFRNHMIESHLPLEKNPEYVLHKQATQLRKEYLEKCFDSVTLVNNHPYLPQTVSKSGHEEYIVAKGMKN